jgi:hypothetical protein
MAVLNTYMNSFSHIRIGNLLNDYLKKNYGVTLCKMSYLYGNLLPDFSRRYKSRPHQPECWENYLKQEYKALLERSRRGMRLGRASSRRLGIISHFLADFFCYPHTNTYAGTSVAHIKYEWHLNAFLRKNLEDLRRTDFGSVCEDGFESTPGAGGERAFACFEKLYKEYADQEPSYANDVLYTLSAGADSLAMITHSGAAFRHMPAAQVSIPSGLEPAAAEA